MRNTLYALLAVILISAGACSNDSTRPGPGGGDGTVTGEISGSDFEFQIEGGDPTTPFAGPFLLRGTNLHYDGGGALVVDLSVRNNGAYSHHEPIGLTFIRLDPDGVTLLNPDNDIHDDGAAIVFHFTNDDGMWTPGEESLLRTVAFGVEEGVSVAFVARLDIGGPLTGGTIAGRVWSDLNEDGMMDRGEPGIAGTDVILANFVDDGSTELREFATTETGPDGHYAFTNVPAGGYVVAKATPIAHMRPTTPTEIHVLLVETNTGVSSYLDANFGYATIDDTPPPFEVGQYVRASGQFLAPDMLGASFIEHVMCADDSVPPPVVKVDGIGCPDGRLRGPVTEIAPLRNAFRLMATWILVGNARFPDDIQVGTRLDVNVHPGPGPTAWITDSIMPWDQRQDEIHGRIQAVERTTNGPVRIRVLDTWVLPYNVVPPMP